jgi:hypothetical protein
VTKIVKVITIDEKGNTKVWAGSGSVMVVQTKTPIPDTLPVYWPKLTYIYIHMIPIPQ